MILLLLAAAVVYQSSPQRHLSAQGSSAGTDQLYVIANVGVGARLFQVTDDGTYTSVGFVSSPDCTFDRFYGMDTAPDGTVYAMARCYSDDGNYWYGRFDPEAAKFTRLHGLQNTALDAYSRFNITFPAQFGAPGTPIGYRTRYNAGVGTDLYAIDGIAPYREHLLDGGISPTFANVSIGVAMSQDGSAIFPVSAVEAFQLVLQPVRAETVTSAAFYGGFGISGDAVVTGINATGYFSIFYDDWWRMIKPTTGQVNPGIKLIGLNPISGAFLRRAPLGGVRIEPHKELTTSESGTTATFTAVLTAEPTANVTVSFTSSDTSEGTVSPASATFTSGDWDTPQTITVTGVLDNDTDDQPFTIVTAATSADANYNGRGVLDVDVTNTNVNQGPAFTPGSPSAQQGSTATATLGTASDLETAAESLTVITIAEPAGVTVGTITNTAGTITAPLSTSCSATTGAGTLRLRVTDEFGEPFEQDVTVTVLPNTAPTLGTYNATSVLPGGSTTVPASAAPGDNGSISLEVSTHYWFTGTLSVNALTGTVSVSNAGPDGPFPVTIKATDNCGATVERTFLLLVNTPPTFTPGTPSARQGSPAATATLGTVDDVEADAGLLAVAVPAFSVPAGVTVGTLVNTNGTITAPVSATCSATTGARTLTIRVTDPHGEATEHDVPVTVLANTAPTLGTYSNASLVPGGFTTVVASAALADNGSISLAEASSPGFTGSLSVNTSTGAVSIGNAGPAGVHSITMTATDNCGATVSRTFDLTVNTPPTLSAQPWSQQQGRLEAPARLGTVSDIETAPGSLSVTAVTVPGGVTVGTITNPDGLIIAPLSVSCSVTPGAHTLTLRVSDGVDTTDQDVTVTVLENTAPTLGTYAAASVTPGASTSVPSTAGPDDTGALASFEVSSPTFTGLLSMNSTTGTVSVSNAAPSGIHTITITVTDTCGAAVSRTFDLTVNALPTLTPATPSAQQGSPATAATLGSVSDVETAAGSLTVATVTVPSGLTVGAITNTGGTIAAPLTATCIATPGARTLTLRVTDGIGATTDQDVTVTVLANTSPTVGSYAASSVAFEGSIAIPASAAPADNGTVMSVSVSSATFTGTLSVNASGTVSVSNAGPIGAHTVTITATDNCGATTTTTFTLNVTCPAFSLGAPGAAFTVGGGSGSVAVTAAPGCAWTSSSAAPWVNLVSGSGNGPGTATFTVAENRSGAPRSTNLTIGGLPFTVAQSLGFADTVIIAGVTPIRALHLLELRIRIDRLRTRLELPSFGWADASVTSAVTRIRAVHVNELRTALLQAYAAIDQEGPTFTDQSISSAMVIRAVHLNELRAAIIALEGALQLP